MSFNALCRCLDHLGKRKANLRSFPPPSPSLCLCFKTHRGSSPLSKASFAQKRDKIEKTVLCSYCGMERLLHLSKVTQKGASPESMNSSVSNFPHKSKTTWLLRPKHSDSNARVPLSPSPAHREEQERSRELWLTWWAGASAPPPHPCHC